MSAALAIAATSEVLHYLVQTALTQAASLYGFAAPLVSTGAPPKPTAGNGVDPAAVNLFLHSAAPNAAMRNHNHPIRDGQGRRLNNAPLVLDLHYLLSAHGPEAVREIGFGTAMHILHQAGIVPRAVIRDALKALLNNADQAKAALATDSGLADQLESLTITTQPLDLDALTKIWTALQVPFRPSAGYIVTTVFLEDIRPQRATLPVLSTSLTPVTLRTLTIGSVAGRNGDAAWPLVVDADIRIEGEGLNDPDLTATLAQVPLDVVPSSSGATYLTLRVPGAGVATLRAGPMPLLLVLSADVNGRRAPVQTASATLLLRPSIAVAANPGVPATPGDPATVTGPVDLTVTPPVGRSQVAVLRLTPVLGGANDVAATWIPPAPAIPPVDAFTALSFQLKKVPIGTYLVRLEVDKVSSQPMPDNAGVFQPQVTL